jgi:hypothetical protein
MSNRTSKLSKNNINRFSDLLRCGYHLMQIHPEKKTPARKGWRDAAPLTAAEAAEMKRCGVRLRDVDLVVDIDPRNGGSIDALEKACGPIATVFPMVDTPHGFHFYMTKPPGAVRHTLRELPGIEFKTLGRFVVAPGSVGYEWDIFGTMPPPACPESVLNLIQKPAIAPADGQPGEWTCDELAETLDELDVTEFRDHDYWFSFMGACHEATGGMGIEEFIRWSTADPEYANDEGKIRSRWSTLTVGKTGNAGIGTLRKVLEEHGIEVPRSVVNREVTEFTEVADIGEDAELPKTQLELLSERFKHVNDKGIPQVYEYAYDEELGCNYWRIYKRQNFLETCRSVLRLPLVQFGKTAKGDPKYMPTGQFFLDHYAKTKIFDDVVFIPGGASDKVLNLWQGFAFEPSEHGSWKYMQEMTREILCDNDEESYEYVMNWMACAVQMPQEPGGTALVFKGPKGHGKGSLANAFVELFGKHGMHISSHEQFVGRFNAHLWDKVALFAHEAFWAGDKKAEGVLKGLITEREITYEAKFQSARKGKNRIHIIMASNDDWVVPAGMDRERRYAVFNVPDSPRDDKYWGRLHNEMKNGGYAKMLWDLQRRDISAFNPQRDIPKTQALVEQKIRTMDTKMAWLYEAAENEWLSFGEDHGDRTYLADSVYRSFIDYCDAQKVRNQRMSKIAFGMWLIPKWADKRHVTVTCDGDAFRKWAYKMPDPAETTRRIDEKLGR